VTRAELKKYCLAKPGAWEDSPWGDTVVKVGPKIFVFLSSSGSGSDSGSDGERDRVIGVGVKCGNGRDEADEWLRRYPNDAAKMAYIGRSGWNTLTVGGAIPDEEIYEAIDESYRMVVAKLPKKDRPA